MGMTDAEYQWSEDREEIRRHHKAFKEISDLCTQHYEGLLTADEAIRKVRNIVG